MAYFSFKSYHLFLLFCLANIYNLPLIRYFINRVMEKYGHSYFYNIIIMLNGYNSKVRVITKVFIKKSTQELNPTFLVQSLGSLGVNQLFRALYPKNYNETLLLRPCCPSVYLLLVMRRMS